MAEYRKTEFLAPAMMVVGSVIAIAFIWQFAVVKQKPRPVYFPPRPASLTYAEPKYELTAESQLRLWIIGGCALMLGIMVLACFIAMVVYPLKHDKAPPKWLREWMEKSFAGLAGVVFGFVGAGGLEERLVFPPADKEIEPGVSDVVPAPPPVLGSPQE